MVEQHFCLRWNNYRTNITAEFEVLREGQHFVDVTLACDGHQLKAHKVVLSACSPYFKELLQGNPCSHPIIILRDVAFLHMRGLLEFMYAGEVNVSQAHLAAFLRTAEALKIRGLAEAPAPDHQAVAAAAAAAVTNSMADLLALKSSIGSLPLVPLASPIAQPPPPPSTLSDAKNIPPIHLSNKSGLLSNLSELSNENIDKRDIKVDLCSEPLPLTVNNNIQPKDLRSPSPHQRNKRLKCSHGGSGESSAPSSPQSYYPSNTPHSNGSATGDIPGEDIAHDLSSNKMHHHHLSEAGNGGGGGGGNIKRRSSSASSANCNNSSTTTAAAASCGVNTQVSSVSVASLPPSLVTSSPDHMQYAVKSEPLDGCGGGSDTEGGCGGSWHEDSVGSDGECSNVKAMDALPPQARAGGSTTPVSRSATTTQHSPMPPVSAQQQHQQISPPPHAASHLMHTSSVQQHQESHLAGLSSELSDRSYGYEDMRSEHYRSGERSSSMPGSTLDSLDSARPGSPNTLPPSSLPHECQVCGKLISCRRNLWKHMERVHFTNPAVRCSICAKLFKNKYALKDHQRIYHGGLSEPLPPSHHHPQSQASFLRILRDSRSSCQPGRQSSTSPASLPPRPSCSIVSGYQPRQGTPESHVLQHPHPSTHDIGPIPGQHHSTQPVDSLSSSSHRRRSSQHHHNEDDDLSPTGSSLHSIARYPPSDRPPIIPHSLPPQLSSSSNSPSCMMGSSRRDWGPGMSTEGSPSMPMPSPHSIFPDIQNPPSKSD